MHNVIGSFTACVNGSLEISLLYELSTICNQFGSTHQINKNFTASAADSDTFDVAPSFSASDELIRLMLRPSFFNSDQKALFPISSKQSALRPFKILRDDN